MPPIQPSRAGIVTERKTLQPTTAMGKVFNIFLAVFAATGYAIDSTAHFLKGQHADKSAPGLSCSAMTAG
jgi:hypothetical protein